MNRSNKIKLMLDKLNPDKVVRQPNGNADSRIDHIYAIKNESNSLWHLAYEGTPVPVSLQQQFTTLNGVIKRAAEYFKGRNLKIKEIID